ncbi:hypothetical protein DL765_010555 [Monosporascus sp. GIB2]|nr:hypothetical protein DL765_010555 [Monosporascus sp. GIB2]
MATNGNINHADQFQSVSNTPSTTSNNAPSVDQTSSGSANNSNLSKDEVAWFFVEQYYTTLSKTPEKLHLFYGKRSQFVYGREAEVANVSVGRQNIQERIKELDFQDCKVRVSNVDSQASDESIVIQVIGETSNKAGDPKKFVQTFVLAQQPSGYFVLNDILRYIDEEADEEPAETPRDAEAASEELLTATTAEAKEEPTTAAAEPAEETAVPALDAGVVDQKLEEVTEETSAADEAPVAEAPTETSATETDIKTEGEKAPDPDVTAQEVAEEAVREAEKPVDPSPTPVKTRQPPPPASAPAPPAQPAKPMTWASRAAAAAAPRPVVPLPKAAVPAAQPRPAAPAQSAATQTAAPAAQNTEPAAPATPATPATPAKETSTEWQTAGGDSKRQNRPQSISGPQAEKDGTMGYVKYVTEKVKHDDLKAALAQHGELAYFDINRQKNCAFVEFATPAGYQAAIAANPHTVNGESIVVEPRRPKSGAYGGSNYSAGRGNVSNRGGRGGFDGRSGSQGGRGGFGGQNRGRAGIVTRLALRQHVVLVVLHGTGEADFLRPSASSVLIQHPPIHPLRLASPQPRPTSHNPRLLHVPSPRPTASQGSHLDLDVPGLGGEVLGDGVEGGDGAVDVVEEAGEQGEEGLRLGALALHVGEEARVVRLRRLQARVELRALLGEVWRQVRGEDHVGGEDVGAVGRSDC